MNVGQVTCVQQHKGELYALQKDKCRIYIREGDKWLTYAEPKSSKCIKEFKLIFNGEIYAYFEGDKHVYQWTGNKNKWIDISRQPCESYEVERVFVCVLSNGSFVSREFSPSWHTTSFQRSSNVIWTLWMLDGR